jgi:hypothetical protein
MELIFFGIIAFLIAHFLGSKRQIGFGWSLFFCLFLSPLGGFITTMLSRKYYDPNPVPSNSKKIWGWILIVLFSLGLIVQLLKLGRGYNHSDALMALDYRTTAETLPLTIGFIGLGFYLIELGNGKNFNPETLKNLEE